MLFKLADADRFDAVKAELEADPRLTVELKRERRFYADQSEALATFLTYLGTGISIIFSIGAIIGAISGGGKGAAIGAIIGAGAGAGSVYAQGRDDLELGTGTELILRANGSR